MRASIPLGLLALALAGCVNMAPERAQPEVTAQLPEAFPNSENAAEYRPEAWWTAFQDPVLDALVQDALADNLDIAEASARVAQAAAQARVARSALLPGVNASADASYSSTPLGGSAFGGLAGGGAGGSGGTRMWSWGAGRVGSRSQTMRSWSASSSRARLVAAAVSLRMK